MEKLVVGIMGQDAMKFLKMCLASVKGADKIVYIDGGSSDGSIEYAKENGCEIIKNTYNQTDKEMNGKQRNVFLNYVKIHYPEDWCLFCDADEVVDDIEKIKEFIQTAPVGLFSVKMRHLIGDLGHEDATEKEHVCLHRLFKISEAGSYPLIEHPVLQPAFKDTSRFKTDITTIWHLAYVPNVWTFKQRYESHSKKSQMHTPEYLRQWYKHHLFGSYPKKEINPVELPEVILKEFGIEKDELYFANRGIEPKLLIDAVNWKQFFKPNSVLEVGCGLGPRVWAMDAVGMEAYGFDYSSYAIQNCLMPKNMWCDDIRTLGTTEGRYDLVVCYDCLEHLEGEGLDKGIENIISLSGKHILISVPAKGDPNYYNDPTHKTERQMEWWKKRFTGLGCTEVPVPENFLFRQQTFIMKVPDEN